MPAGDLEVQLQQVHHANVCVCVCDDDDDPVPSQGSWDMRVPADAACKLPLRPKASLARKSPA